MSDDQLAILGGRPVIGGPLPPYRSMGEREAAAVAEVVRRDLLSGFYGSWGEEFLGGPLVREFERNWAQRFGTRHAVSVNSATSGLFAAVGAIGVGPGDEVVVPPYTMSATAMAPLVYGAVPVFADVDEVTFCISVESVERVLTSRTRAIIAVDLFGQPAPLQALRRLADKRGIHLIEDAAQAPLAAEGDRLAGTVGHIGVFSLNYHKHVHTGEGGMCVTDDDGLATRLQLIRNHGENAVEPLGIADLANLIGFNYRMTELSAAVGLVQLDAIDEHVGRRVAAAEFLSNQLGDLEGLRAPVVRPDCRHVYYVWALRVLEAELGISRQSFSQALAAEGFPHFQGYTRPLYLLPVFQRRVAMGRDGFPFKGSRVRYEAGLCPVTERLHDRELIGFEPCAYDLDESRLVLLVEAVRKVHKARGLLAGHVMSR